MQGLRCPDCGATRWHLLPVKAGPSRECSVCGSEMKPERRLPGRGRGRVAAERRQTTV